MKDLRIVIVSWNVSQLLRKCLQLIPQACQGLDWECIIVDNASKDDSVAVAKAVSKEIAQDRIQVLEAGENLGFAKACNLGSKDADVRYFLYLNPDTECPIRSLSNLVRTADRNPEAGILGPKLVYPDGTFQESVRRFPTFLDQAGIVLKMVHLFPKLKIFQKYFARDLDQNLEQDVDQVMGACFLVRSELITQKLGFDERYFIWMEEVDFCKVAIQKGWTVRYIPSISVIHHRGKSFEQEFQPRKQKYFTTSLIKYFDKWHPGPQAWTIRMIAPIGQGAVWSIYAMRQYWGRWLAALLSIEFISCISVFNPTAMSLVAVIAASFVAFLAWKRPWIAISALLLEILIGSKGAILFVGQHPQTVSFRILLFVAFIVGWSLNILAEGNALKRIASWVRFLQGRWAYVCLLVVICFALIRGIALGNGATVWKDANAWGFWILLLPILDIVTQHGERAQKHVIVVLKIGISWIVAKTLLISYIFSHGFRIARYLYPWIRRTGVGEITIISGNFFRIFFQSHIYSIFAIVVLGVRQLFLEKRSISWLLAGTVAVGILGLSRSFWLGTVVGVACAFGLTYKFCSISKKQWKYAARGISLSVILGICLGIGSVILPLPPVDMASLSAVIGNRTDGGEAAVISRWNLLSSLKQKIALHPIVGSGFGATVTYETKDPRIIHQSGGTYTTSTFEWGWLEHWVKFGIIGIPLMMWIVSSIAWRVWRSSWDIWLRISGITIVVMLSAIHVFTPYLNHPLGISVILFIEACIERGKVVYNRRMDKELDEALEQIKEIDTDLQKAIIQAKRETSRLIQHFGKKIEALEVDKIKKRISKMNPTK
ncbi:glycosyltransferase [Candidatus Uhrbacteria bacterium]|nr:glycosyltransferase [Candidatus Uhrbacteria bacterium]